MTRPSRILIAVLSIGTAYVGSFYLLMVPNCRAYDWNDQPAFHNCPRFSESYRVPGPLTIETGRANFLNYVYYPFEFIHRGPRVKSAPNQTVERTGASRSGQETSRASAAAGSGR
jgi:hypothetical protein